MIYWVEFPEQEWVRENAHELHRRETADDASREQITADESIICEPGIPKYIGSPSLDNLKIGMQRSIALRNEILHHCRKAFRNQGSKMESKKYR
jgi:hypothetical protein